MFGIVRPCRHHLPPGLHRRWAAHLCGMCLTLRDEHGQLARVTTNYDTVLVSVLVGAQEESPGEGRRAGPCPARGMRTAHVVTGDAARLAAHAALLLAADHLTDHVDDAQGAFRHIPVAAAGRRVARRWSARATATAPGGFDPAPLLAIPARQHAVEHRPGRVGLDEATAPTADAVAAAFAHTAVLAGRPANIAPLAEAGRAFGRLAHLVDAVTDLDDDRRHGRWNPVDGAGGSLADAHSSAQDAVATLERAMRDLTVPDPRRPDARLAHRLLVHETARAWQRAQGPGLRTDEPSTDRPGRPGDDPGGDGDGDQPGKRARPPRGLLAGCAAAGGLCCTGQLCCADEFVGPWSGRPRSNPCASCCDCSCDACDCGDGCSSCCDCCDCGS